MNYEVTPEIQESYDQLIKVGYKYLGNVDELIGILDPLKLRSSSINFDPILSEAINNAHYEESDVPELLKEEWGQRRQGLNIFDSFADISINHPIRVILGQHKLSIEKPVQENQILGDYRKTKRYTSGYLREDKDTNSQIYEETQLNTVSDKMIKISKEKNLDPVFTEKLVKFKEEANVMTDAFRNFSRIVLPSITNKNQ